MPWTPLPADPDKGFLAFLGEYVEATRERARAVDVTPPLPLALGDIVQRRSGLSVIRQLHNVIEATLHRYLMTDPLEGSSVLETWTVEALAEALHGPGVESPWRRYTVHPDDGGSLAYGKQEPGDIEHGLWIFEDLQAVLNLLTKSVRWAGNALFGYPAPMWRDGNTGLNARSFSGFGGGTSAAGAYSAAVSDWSLGSDNVVSFPQRFAFVQGSGSSWSASLFGVAANQSVTWPALFRDASQDGGASVTRHARVGFWIRPSITDSILTVFEDFGAGMSEDKWHEFDSIDDATVSPGGLAYVVSPTRWPADIDTPPSMPGSPPAGAGWVLRDVDGGSVNGAIVFDWAVPGGFEYVP